MDELVVNLLWALNASDARSEVTAPSGTDQIVEEQILNSTGAFSFLRVLVMMVVIDGGIIGLEMGSVWNRWGSEVTAIKFLNSLMLMSSSSPSAVHRNIGGLGLENIGVEVDACGRIAINDPFNTIVPKIKYIGDVTFSAYWHAYPQRVGGHAAPEYILSGHGHVSHNMILSVVYTHPEMAWLGRTRVRYKFGCFLFLDDLRAKMNLDTKYPS
ncbi:hypothetical protein BJV74DRAFT_890189 [Russula compacta]|nr:hypothetical protein BJV74DRAFT_890189 [Russula compacta]